APTPVAAQAQYVRIKNKWQNTYLFQSSNQVRYGTPAASDTASHWLIEDFQGAKRIKNRATGHYMAIENQQDYVESIPVQDAWESARWTVESAPAPGYSIIRNVWHNAEILHVENLRGYAQHTNIPTSWDSPQWLLEPVSGTTTPTPTTPTPTSAGQTPYGGSPRAIPGTVQAEDFDNGGEGVAFHDNDAANAGTQYRSTGVDIESTGDTGGGYNVGWIGSGEWLEYTVNVQSAGTYTLAARVASGGTSGSFRVEFGGVDKTGTVAVPNTGGWQSWANVSRTVNLSAGQQVLRVYFTGSDFNLNSLSFSTGGVTPTPVTPTPITPTPITPTAGPTATPAPGGNLALGKPISASSSVFTFVATNANDGSLTTYWEGGSNPSTLAVDLGANANITSVVLKLNPDTAWSPRTQTVQVLGRTQGSTGFSQLVGATSYSFNPASGNSVTIPVAATVSAVQLHISSNSGAPAGQVAEFQVFGTPAPNPDLRVSGLSWTPAAPTELTALTLAATVVNSGSAAAGATTVSFSLGGTAVGSANVPALAAGASTTVSLNIGTRGQGSYSAAATVDPSNTIVELDNGNNSFTASAQLVV
ncbi:MAG TPA: carbohydrate-binding protein, partial [Roseiflexaceae bacterium]|nr:carbohydrate-binding protein [Roseiflexaceae bacterium]